MISSNVMVVGACKEWSLRFPTDNRVGRREWLPYRKVSRTARCRAKTLVDWESRKVCCLCVAAAFCWLSCVEIKVLHASSLLLALTAWWYVHLVGLLSLSNSAKLADIGVDWWSDINLVDPASSHMLVSKIKPCMFTIKSLHDESANGSLKQLWFIWWSSDLWITVVILELIHA